MITSAVPSWVETLRDSAVAVAAVAGALVTIVAAAKVPIVRRPTRWLWRVLVAEPVGGWVHELLDRWAESAPVLEEIHDRLKVVEHEVLTNDGESLRDVAERVEVMSIELMRRTG